MRVSGFGFVALGTLALASPALAQTSATTATELNLRSGPGPRFEVIGVIPSGSAVEIEGCLDAGLWCRVDHAGQTGWAHAGYLSAEAAGEPVIVGERRTEVSVPVVSYDEGDVGGGLALGATSGALAGAVLGGPIGAAVGAVAGAALGGASNVPEPVVSYVRSNRVEPVYLEGEVVVGAQVPETVELTPVPESEYRYIDVNGVPAVVEPQTRRIIYVVR